MPDSYTSHLGLTLCEVGASRDSWGSKWNANLTTLDALVFQSAPIGMLADFAGPTPPSGWLIADGRQVSRTTYSALFAVIGGYYGVGDGSTTFNLPNLNGRSTVGPGVVIDQNGINVAFSFTQSTGAIYNQIQQTHLPNYNLVTDVQGWHAHGGATTAGGNHTHSTDVQGYHSHGGGTTAAGDHSHTGYTDAQGNHQHNVSAWNSAGGGGGLAVGSVPTQGNSQTDFQGNHSHNIQTYNAGNHAHGIYADGSHGHNISYTGDFIQLGIYGDGNHQHNVSLGGGGNWFEVLNPILVVTKIIYAGTQAGTMVAAAAATTSVMTLDAQDELAVIRQELADLRAILAPPGRPRALSAPLRGPH